MLPCPEERTARGTRGSPLLPRFHFGSENKPSVKQVPVMVTRSEPDVSCFRALHPRLPQPSCATVTPLRLTHHLQLVPILPARKPRARNKPQGTDELPSPDGRRWGCCPLCLHHLIARLVPKMEWKIAVSISRAARAEAALAVALPLPSSTCFKGCGKCVTASVTPKAWSKIVCHPSGGCL